MKTYKPRGRYRLLAEWETAGPVMLAYPAAHTDWNYMLAEAQDQCLRLVGAMLNAGQRVLLLVPPQQSPALSSHPLLKTVEVEYNDTWTRDYGALTVADSQRQMRLLDFGFNAWGLKLPPTRITW